MTTKSHIRDREFQGQVRRLAEAWGLTPSQRDINKGGGVQTFRSSCRCFPQRSSSGRKNRTGSRNARPRRIKASSYIEYESRRISAARYFPFDPSYLFCGTGSVQNYRKKRFGRLRNRVSLVG